MAITLDTVTNKQSAGKVTSLTSDSWTVAANTLVTVVTYNNDARSGMTATFNGVNMALDAQTAGNVPVYLFSTYVTSGVSATVVVTVNAAATDVWIRGASWLGLANAVKEASATGTATSATATNTLTTTSTGSLHISGFVNEDGFAQTAGSGTQAVPGATDSFFASSPYAVSAIGSSTLTVTHTSSLWRTAGASYGAGSGVSSASLFIGAPF